jgi:MinD superfamily P-loop ATPase
MMKTTIKVGQQRKDAGHNKYWPWTHEGCNKCSPVCPQTATAYEEAIMDRLRKWVESVLVATDQRTQVLMRNPMLRSKGEDLT